MKRMLVDAFNISYRYNSVLDLTDQRNERVSAIYGAINMIYQWRCSTIYVDPLDIIFCWDGGRSKDRLKLYPEYKGTRGAKSPEEEAFLQEFYKQCDILRKILPAFGVTTAWGLGVEADDLIAWYVENLSALETDDIEIASGDSDFEQLVAFPGVRILPASGNAFGVEEIVAKRGVGPEAMAAWKALVGDGSDNIPGVPGIGEKRAAEVLLAYPSLARGKAVFRGAGLGPGAKYAAKIQEHQQLFERAYQLIKLPSDLVQVNKHKFTIVPGKFDRNVVWEFLREHAFAQFLARFNRFSAMMQGDMGYIHNER